ARGPGDHENRMPWVARVTTGPPAFACELQGETLLAVHELGAHETAIAALAVARGAYREELAQHLSELEAKALADPRGETVLDYLFAVREVEGENAARQRLRDLLPRIPDPVLSEKLMRGLLETGPKE